MKCGRFCVWSWGFGIAALSFTAPALAEPSPAATQVGPDAPVFGQRGQLVVTSAFALSAGYLREGGRSLITFDFSPSAHYFVAQNFSLGLGVTVRQSPYVITVYNEYGPGADVVSHSTTLAIAGSAGYNAPLGKLVSLWTRADFGFADNQYPGLAAPSAPFSGHTSQGVWLELFAPFLVHPVPHFFVGLGPDLLGEIALSRGPYATKQFGAGIGSTVGGWL